MTNDTTMSNGDSHDNNKSHIVHVTDQSFAHDVLQSDIPVLVDFWAKWCMPCRTLLPILDELATQYAGRLKIAKVDIDESSAVAGSYGVRGIPTLLLVKNGEVVDTKVGSLPKGQLINFIDSNL